MTRRMYFIFALITASFGLVSLPAAAQSGRTFYIDYSNGSNSNNGTSKSTPWKSHPYMNHSSGCDSGSRPSYTHQAGDRFIFKGGVSWPPACFGVFIPTGGTSVAPDYYGVDQTWFNGATFSRPLIDMGYIAAAGNHIFNIASGQSNITFDNFEIAHQLINTGAGYTGAGYAFRATDASFPIIIKNSYMHDWGTNLNLTDAASGDWGEGCIGGGTTSSAYHAIMDTSTCSDVNGYIFSGGVKVPNIQFGGACEECAEVKNSTFQGDWAGCFTVKLCHDSEFFGFNSSANNYCNSGGSGCHTQVIENDIPIMGEAIYNNLIHDNQTGVTILSCAGDPIYNNVMWNNTGGTGIPIQADSNCGSSASTVSNVYNNTVDCNGGTCFRAVNRAGYTFGQLNAENNLFINATTQFCINNPGGSCATITSGGTISNNYTMSTSEASIYGFTSARKYAPSSSDSHVTGQGANLSSFATASLAALASDAAGAPWFGGSYNARTSTWDLGAFVVGAQSSSKPNPPSGLAAIVQ